MTERNSCALLLRGVKYLASLLLFTAAIAAQAGQRFSFAGLAWGDSLTQVEQKLHAAGHSSTTQSSGVHWVPPGGERREFTGKVAEHPFEGALHFRGDKLSQVQLSFLVAGSKQSDEVHKLFITRYGQPRQMGSPSYDWEWTSAYGESLTLSSTSRRSSAGTVIATYASPDAMKASKEQKAKDEAAARLDRRKAEALNKQKAAGL